MHNLTLQCCTAILRLNIILEWYEFSQGTDPTYLNLTFIISILLRRSIGQVNLTENIADLFQHEDMKFQHEIDKK